MASNTNSSIVYEADNDNVMIKLILPNGEIKEHFIIRTKSTVAREKSRIIAEAQVREPPEKDIMLVLLESAGRETEMNEDQLMKSYVATITNSSAIELRDRRSVAATPLSRGYNADPETTFGVNMR